MIINDVTAQDVTAQDVTAQDVNDDELNQTDEVALETIEPSDYICPTCNDPCEDHDGRPSICCDNCDLWYHMGKF